MGFNPWSKGRGSAAGAAVFGVVEHLVLPLLLLGCLGGCSLAEPGGGGFPALPQRWGVPTSIPAVGGSPALYQQWAGPQLYLAVRGPQLCPSGGGVPRSVPSVAGPQLCPSSWGSPALSWLG